MKLPRDIFEGGGWHHTISLTGMDTRDEPRNVFDWLDQIRRRPGMFVGESSAPLGIIETLIGGYYAALSVHGMVEPVPAMSNHFEAAPV